MIEIDAKKLTIVAEDMNIRVNVRYSGRGMSGKQCVGVIGDIGDVLRFILTVVPEVDRYAVDGTYREEWLDVKSDNMGLSMIFYWPDVRVVHSKDEDEE